MKKLIQNQSPERHSKEKPSMGKEDFLQEIIGFIQLLQKADTLSFENFKEMIHRIKSKKSSDRIETRQSLFAVQNKDYLINIIKNIG